MKNRNCKKEESRKRWSRPGYPFIFLSGIALLTAVILAVSPSARLSGGGKAGKLLSQEADTDTHTYTDTDTDTDTDTVAAADIDRKSVV